MDNAINDLLDAIVPNLADLLSDIRFWMGFAMLVGPILLLLLGAYYLFLAPPEANHKAGYRTYFGMGSIGAWRYTQNLAGKVFGILGVVLLITSIIFCIVIGNKEAAEAVMLSLLVLIGETVCALAAYGVVEITVMCRFNENGNKRK